MMELSSNTARRPMPASPQIRDGVMAVRFKKHRRECLAMGNILL